MAEIQSVFKARTPMELIRYTVENQVWEAVTEDDLDHTSLRQIYSWLATTPESESAVEKAVEKAKGFTEFESILMDECPGECLISVEPFWDELVEISTEAVNTIWSQCEDQLAILLLPERVALRQKLLHMARRSLTFCISVD